MPADPTPRREPTRARKAVAGIAEAGSNAAKKVALTSSSAAAGAILTGVNTVKSVGDASVSAVTSSLSMVNMASQLAMGKNQSTVTELKQREKARRQRMGQPSSLSTQLKLLSVRNLDLVAGTWEGEIELQAVWKCTAEMLEERLAAEESQRADHWEPGWVPKFKLANAVQMRETQPVRFYLEVSDEDDAILLLACFHYSFTLPITLDLRAHPFDMQTLQLTVLLQNGERLQPMSAAEVASFAGVQELGLASNDLQQADVHGAEAHGGGSEEESEEEDSLAEATVLRARKASLYAAMRKTTLEDPDGHLAPAQLVLPGVHLSAYLVDADLVPLYAFSGKQSMHLVIFIRRNPTFYVVNNLCLLFALVMCSLMTYVLSSEEQLADRMSLTVVMLLVGISFKQIEAATRPPLSYLTLLDYYTLGAIGFLILCLFSHVFIGYLDSELDLERVYSEGARGRHDDAEGASVSGGLDEAAVQHSRWIQFVDYAVFCAYTSLFVACNGVFVIVARNVRDDTKAALIQQIQAAIRVAPPSQSASAPMGADGVYRPVSCLTSSGATFRFQTGQESDVGHQLVQLWSRVRGWPRSLLDRARGICSRRDDRDVQFQV